MVIIMKSEIHQLALQTIDALRGLGLAEHTAWGYYSSTFLPVVRFVEQRGCGSYDEKLLDEYADMLHRQPPQHHLLHEAISPMP
jgi:hypothetical protein